jgi:high-affinity nickel permease
MEKDELRLETNKLLVGVVTSLLKDGHTTVDDIIDNLDNFVRCLMATGCTNASVSTKFSMLYDSLISFFRCAFLSLYKDIEDIGH